MPMAFGRAWAGANRSDIHFSLGNVERFIKKVVGATGIGR